MLEEVVYHLAWKDDFASTERTLCAKNPKVSGILLQIG